MTRDRANFSRSPLLWALPMLQPSVLRIAHDLGIIRDVNRLAATSAGRHGADDAFESVAIGVNESTSRSEAWPGS